jgi:hypothetical protein
MPRPTRQHLVTGTATIALTVLLPAGVASAAATDQVAAAQAAATCRPIVPFDQGNFHDPTRIDNRFLPMVPGTQLVYRGQAGGGAHQVVFTVTDLTKVVDGVTTRVIHDVDIQDGEVAEAELAFFAQDDQGNVWNLGEYPEEYEDGVFAGAPSVWLGGRAGAQPGIHMLARPAQQVGVEYLQGRAPAIDFLDSPTDPTRGGHDTGPPGSFTGVLTTHETSPLESTTAIQTKAHAPDVGIVKIGAINDPEGETLVLTRNARLGPAERGHVDAAAARLDAHGHLISPLYRTTPPVLPG